jgi:hypothetical protein
MQRREMLDGFEFQNDLAIHDDIRQIAGFDLDIIVSDWQANLLGKRDTGLEQFMTEAPLINGFQQAGAQAAMNVHRETYDAPGELSAMGKLGFHFVDPANVTAGLTGMTDKPLMDLQRKQ